jgi:3-phenylpropionate/cinnamic acid dioxygenase small subunit
VDLLQSLLDEREIVRGLGRFARVLDTKRWGDLAEVFDPELTFDYGQGERQGLEALDMQMRRYLDACGPTQHLIGSILVEVEEDDAVSRAYVQARHQHAGATTGPVFDSSGEYTDRWARRPQGWRIVRRQATWFVHSGDPAVLGAAPAELG